MTNGIALRVGGPRTTVTTEEAEQVKQRWEKEIVAAASDGDTVQVQKLDLSCRQWTAEACQVIRPVVEKIASTLLIADIQDTIAGLETSKGFEVMELFTEMLASAKQVTEINMNDNATGPRVLERIAPLLGSTSVKKVYFNNCGLSAETMPQLDEALTSTDGMGMARLEAMHLNKNMIGVEGAKFVGEKLPSCIQLIDFSYCGCRPTKAGTSFIAKGLKNLVETNDSNSVALQQLKLEDCDFGGDDGEFPILQDLANALEKLSKLTTLNLRDAGDLEETGAGIVSQALITSNCKLVDLDLSGCCFGEDGAQSISELIGKNLGSLKVLKLETNEFGNDGVEKILSAFKGGDNCLERLHLDENELDDGAIDLLLDASLPKLRVLSLKDNMDLEEADDGKKEELRKKFANATVMIADDDEEPADVKEDPDAEVDALADELANL